MCVCVCVRVRSKAGWINQRHKSIYERNSNITMILIKL